MTSQFNADEIRRQAEEEKFKNSTIKQARELREATAKEEQERLNQLIQQLLTNLVNQLGWKIIGAVKYYERISTKLSFIDSHVSGRAWYIEFRDDANSYCQLSVYYIEFRQLLEASTDHAVYDWGQLAFTVPASPRAKIYTSFLQPDLPVLICQLDRHHTQTQVITESAIKDKLSELIVKYLSKK